MITRYIWKNCNFRHFEWDRHPNVDAFWIEADVQEAEEHIFPLISEALKKQSHRLVQQYADSFKRYTNSSRPYGFLVARDLTSIDPFNPFYPVHHMWNAYSPFRAFAKIEIISLKELAELRPLTEDIPDNHAAFSQELKEFVDKESWIFAKTYAKTWPHEYLVKKRVNPELFTQLVRHIRKHGYQGSFYRKPITYFDESGMVYWTMGEPVEETTIINRCPKEDSYEYKRDHGLLPEQLVRD